MPDIITGVIPDLHIPGNLDNALEFIQDTFSDHGVTRVISIGDIIDHHYISSFAPEVDAQNPIQEWRLAMAELQKWVKAFPRLRICTGNHDQRPKRAAKIVGLPDTVFLKTLNAIYNLPDAWEWSMRWDIDNVIYEHGLGSNGMYGSKNTAKLIGSSFVQGHTHAHGAVFDIPQVRRHLAAMNVGALIDKDKYQARYAKQIYKTEMSLGCGIVFNESEMKFVPMR